MSSAHCTAPGRRSRPRLPLAAGLAGLFVLAGAHAEDLSMSSGRELYQRFCSSCHGEGAHGDGPSARHFKAEVPDLTRIARRHGGTYPADWVYRIIDGREVRAPHGSRDMPAWGTELREVRTAGDTGGPGSGRLIQRLVDYLATLQVATDGTTDTRSKP
jgi:mono/diheme cytochrome c family protein